MQDGIKDELQHQFEEKINLLKKLNERMKSFLTSEEISDLFNINEYNFKDNFQKVTYLMHFFEDERIKEENRIRKYEQELAVIKGDLYHELRFESDEELKKTEIEKYYIPRNEKVQELSTKISNFRYLADQYKSLQNLFKTLNMDYRTMAKENII